MVKFVLRSPVLKVQFASQQFPYSGSGNVPNLLCLAHLLIVDFVPEHQHFFLVGRLTLFLRARHQVPGSASLGL